MNGEVYCNMNYECDSKTSPDCQDSIDLEIQMYDWSDSPESDFVQELENEGWELDKEDYGHFCPECIRWKHISTQAGKDKVAEEIEKLRAQIAVAQAALNKNLELLEPL